MAAHISFIDGKAEAAFALKPAWWDTANEYTLDHVPNSEEMIKAAHLDWEVEMQPIYDNDGRLIPGHATSIRTDTGLHLGVMSDQYRPIQNKTAFSFLDSLLKDGGIMRFESAGALRGGRTVWALARMPSVDQIAEGDALNRYVLWLNSHDATGALYAIPTNVRVVCSNTARLAIRHQNGIRHIGDMTSKLTAAHKLLSQADKAFTDFRDKRRCLPSGDTAESKRTSMSIRWCRCRIRKGGPAQSGRGKSRPSVTLSPANATSFRRFVERGGRCTTPFPKQLTTADFSPSRAMAALVPRTACNRWSSTGRASI